MDPAVLILLAGLLLIAAQAAWFGFFRPIRTLAWLQQASFVITTFVLVPLVLFVLYSQSTSIDRLQAIGLKPHPSIWHAIGIANGWGENPVWVFDLVDDPVPVLDYYRTALADTHWKVSEDNGLYLRCHRPGQVLTIANTEQPGGGSLIISVTTNHEQ